MYISEEQLEFEKLDTSFRYAVREAKKQAIEDANKLPDITELDEIRFGYSKLLEKAKKPTYKTRGLIIENGVLQKSKSKYRTIHIPAGVTEIGESAFEDCKNSQIIFPDGLKKIGDNAFRNSARICSLDVKEPELCWAAARFYFCEEDEIYQYSRGFAQFPNTLEEIGAYAFWSFGLDAYAHNQTRIDFLILPKSLQRIGKCAFTNCGIETVYIGGPEVVSESCFSRSRRLTKVVFGNGVKYIDRFAFDGCDKLKDIVFPENLIEIGEYAFSYCIGLKKIKLPDTLKKIGNQAFSECGLLSTIEIPDSVTEFGEGAFEKCSNLKMVKLGKGLTAIPEHCFSECNKLVEIEIPATVTFIAKNAFENCKKLVICAEPGSYAERFAMDHGYQKKSTI